MPFCDFGDGKQDGVWCCIHGLCDKCVVQLFVIFHSSFVSCQIYLFSLTLAITDVCSANESAVDMKAKRKFYMFFTRRLDVPSTKA